MDKNNTLFAYVILQVTSYRPDGKARLNHGKVKHPLKIHVWGGISRRGRSHMVMFDGIMESPSTQMRYLPTHCYRSSDRCIQTATALCRTTTPSISLGQQGSIWEKLESTGMAIRYERIVNSFGKISVYISLIMVKDLETVC